MNYQITCVCGHRFSLPAEQLGQHVPCPACHRALIPLATTPELAASPTPQSAAPTTSQATKRCPFCGETILAVAKKCRFCQEFLDRSRPGAASAAPTAVEDETPPVFSLCVSQWDNFFRYLICLAILAVIGLFLFGLPKLLPITKEYIAPHALTIFAAAIFVLGLCIYFIYLAARNARCTIRPLRIDTETGIFSKQIDTLEMFRVQDIELKQNLIQRLLGIGSVILKTTDATTPTLELYQIPKARKVYQYLKNQAPKADQARNTLHVER